MKDDAECKPLSGSYAAHAVPQIYAIHTLAALHRSMANRKHGAISLPERYYNRSRLHAWPSLVLSIGACNNLPKVVIEGGKRADYRRSPKRASLNCHK
jgi:hypothetical protein